MHMIYIYNKEQIYLVDKGYQITDKFLKVQQ